MQMFQEMCGEEPSGQTRLWAHATPSRYVIAASCQHADVAGHVWGCIRWADRGYGGVCAFRKQSDSFRTQTSDPWVDPFRRGNGSHSDRPRGPTQTGNRHPNQTGPRPHSDRAPRIPAESIRTLSPCHGVNGMERRFFLPWHGRAWVHQQLITARTSHATAYNFMSREIFWNPCDAVFSYDQSFS